jgi:hypothetical protein
MPTYRLYSINRKERVVRQALYLECPNDATAIDEAEQLLDRHVLEVWQLTRRVVRLDPCEKNKVNRIAGRLGAATMHT